MPWEWPNIPIPLVEPRGLWIGLLFLALLAVYLWADRKWPGK